MEGYCLSACRGIRRTDHPYRCQLGYPDLVAAASVAQPGGTHAATVAHEHAFVQLEPEAVGVDAGLVEGAGDRVGETGLGELTRRGSPTSSPASPRRATAEPGRTRPASPTRRSARSRPVCSAISRNSVGPQEATRRVLPAQERLDADDRVAGELVDGLVVQDELAAFERAGQFGFELESPRRLRDEPVVEAVPVRAALLLGAVHRGIGVAQQRRRVRVLHRIAVERSRSRCSR